MINLDLDDAVFVQLFQSNLLGCHGVMNRLDGLQPIDYLRLALGVEDPENNEVNGHVRMALQSVLPELRIESAGALIDLGLGLDRLSEKKAQRLAKILDSLRPPRLDFVRIGFQPLRIGDLTLPDGVLGIAR